MEKMEMREYLKKQISIRKVTENELEGVSTLIREMHPTPPEIESYRSRSLQYYEWMYLRNPEGRAIAYCALHGDRIISTFAMVPKRLYCAGEEVLIGKTMDMFTLESYQGLGLMSQLAQRVFEDTRSSKISSWYVTPSENSYPIFLNKWKYKEVIRLQYRSYIIDPAAVISAYASMPLLGKLLSIPSVIYRELGSLLLNKKLDFEISQVTSFDRHTDELWTNMKRYVGLAICRSSKYLNWRYIDNPDDYIILSFCRTSLLRGLIVLKETTRKGIKFGEIVDLMFADNDRILCRAMISYGCKLLKDRGCAAMRAWSVSGSQEEMDLKYCRFKHSKRDVKFLLSPDSEIEKFYDGRSWLLTQGDGNDL